MLFSVTMWQLVGRVLQAGVFTTAAASTVVVGGVLTSALRPPPAPADAVDPAEASLEIRLTTPHPTHEVFVGQPLIIDVTLTNLEARRARNQALLDPDAAVAAVEMVLDDPESGKRWTQRLAMTMSTPGGATVLNRLAWSERLVESAAATSVSRLALAPARATFILHGEDVAALLPGSYVVRAMVPPSVAPMSRISVFPLELDLEPEPTTDSQRALVSLAQARAAALQGDPAAAVEAAMTALALDPLQDDALLVVAEGWEEQGAAERAIRWYERVVEALDATDTARRRALEAYVDALRRQ